MTNSWHEVTDGAMVPNAWTGIALSGRSVFFNHDGDVRCWDATTNETRTVVSDKAIEWHIASSPNGRLVAFRSGDRRVSIADTDTGEILATLPPTRTRLNSMAFSPDGPRLALALVDGGIDVWRLDLIAKKLTKLGLKSTGLLHGRDQIAIPDDLAIAKLGPKVLPDFPDNGHGIAYLRQPEFIWAEDPVLSNDARHLYFTANGSYRFNCLERNSDTGAIVVTDSIELSTNHRIWNIQLSPTNDKAVACGDGGLLLYTRSQETGKLVHRHSYKPQKDGDPTFSRLADVSVSMDGRFVFVCDSQNAFLATLRVTEDDQLEHSFTNVGQDDCFDSINGVVVHPNDEWLYVASGSGTITCCQIDPQTGETTVKQVVRDEEGSVTRLGAADSMAISDDQRFLYVSSGHDGAETAVAVLRIDDSGELSVVQTILPGKDGVPDFQGGIGFAITPDQERAFVCASKSHHLLEFAREPNTGQLSLTQRIPIGRGKSRPTGVTVTPDGRFLYVTLSNNHAIATVPIGD